MTTYEPMAVGTTPTAHGHDPEPRLDPGWGPLDRLRWKAGTVVRDTGLTVAIDTGQGSYTLRVGNSALGPLSYSDAWSVLTGVTIGAAETTRRGGGAA